MDTRSCGDRGFPPGRRQFEERALEVELRDEELAEIESTMAGDLRESGV